MVPLSCLNSKMVIYDWLVQDIGPCGAFFLKETNGQNLLQKMEKQTTWVNASRVQTCKHNPHPHHFVVQLLRKHWKPLFIVHIYVITTSLQINQISSNFIINYKYKSKYVQVSFLIFHNYF